MSDEINLESNDRWGAMDSARANLLARTRTHYRSFVFFAVTSVTASVTEVCCYCFLRALKEGFWSCFDENKPSF